MSLATEQTFRAVVALAEGARQQQKAAAMVTYGYVAANLAAYQEEIADADTVYQAAVTTAADTLAIPAGNAGLSGPIPGASWTPLLSIA
jgi:hypothetical protein